MRLSGMYRQLPTFFCFKHREKEGGKAMKLSQMRANTQGTVKNLGEDEKFLCRITSIGLTEGAEFQVIKNDKRMPVLVYARETLLALNRKDCERIEVE